MSSNSRYIERKEVESFDVNERAKKSMRVLIDLQKALEDKAVWRLQLSDKVDQVRAIEIEAVSFTGVPALGGSPGIPYVPYFELEIVDNKSAAETRVAAAVNGQNVSASNLHGIPLILNNSGYESIHFDTPSMREYARLDLPIGRFENFGLKLRGPQGDANYLNPKFTRLTLLLRLIQEDEPPRRPLRALDSHVDSETIAHAAQYHGQRQFYHFY